MCIRDSSIGANFEKTNFTGANLTRVDFMGATSQILIYLLQVSFRLIWIKA